MANLENKKSLSAKVAAKGSEDEASLWELFWFGIAFVLIFALIVNASRAEAASSHASAINLDTAGKGPDSGRSRSLASSSTSNLRSNRHSIKGKSSGGKNSLGKLKQAAVQPQTVGQGAGRTSLPVTGSSRSSTTSSASTATSAEVLNETDAVESLSSSKNQANTSRLQSKIEARKEKNKTLGERFKGGVAAEYGTTMQPGDAYERSASMSLTFTPSFEFSKDYKLGVKTMLAKDLTSEEQRTVFDNTKLSLIKTAIPLSQVFSFRPAVAVIAPTSSDAKKSWFRGSVGAAGRLLFDLQSIGVPFNGFYNLAYDRNIHDYTTSVDGTPNFRDVVTHVVVLEVPFAGNWTISATSVLVSAWTYRGTVRNFFELAQDLGYKIDDSFSVYIGHTNAGDAYKANGRTSNMAFFNDQASVLRLGASCDF